MITTAIPLIKPRCTSVQFYWNIFNRRITVLKFEIQISFLVLQSQFKFNFHAFNLSKISTYQIPFSLHFYEENEQVETKIIFARAQIRKNDHRYWITQQQKKNNFIKNEHHIWITLSILSAAIQFIIKQVDNGRDPDSLHSYIF